MYIFFKKNYISLMLKLQNINCIQSRIIKLLSQNKLAIFLDIDGTLIPYANHPNNIIVPKNLKYLLCLLYTSPSPRDRQKSRMPSSA